MIIILEIWSFKKISIGIYLFIDKSWIPGKYISAFKMIKNNKLTVMRTVFVVVVSGHSVVDFPGGDIDGDGVGNG